MSTVSENPTEVVPPISQTEIKFLSGPQPRGFELKLLFHIFTEFLRGFRVLHFVGPCVTVFGSARFPEGHRYYEMARKTGALLAQSGFTVMTGGGPGIMEGANRGAKEAGGRSVGCNIELPHEQYANPYLDVMVSFQHFFIRKVMLVKYSYAFIALPGGYGTMDEIFEAATLIQTAKIRDFPLILVGREYWLPIIEVLQSQLLNEGTISEKETGILQVTDSLEQAIASIKETGMQKFGLTYASKVKRRWFFGE